jgi:hypothetical protein
MSRQPRNQGPPVPSTATRQNEYFVPRDGIDREVISADICRYLGNDALVRPGHYEVRARSASPRPPKSLTSCRAEPTDRPGSTGLLHYRLQELDHCEHNSHRRHTLSRPVANAPPPSRP